MKKCIASLLTILCLVLSACYSSVNENIPVTATKTESFSYDVITEQFTDYTEQNCIEIQYPSFTYGAQNCKEINLLIQDALDDYLSVYGNNLSNLTLSVNYEIMYADDEIVSIVFRGTSNLRTAAHPVCFAFSVNISLRNCKIAQTASFVNINDTLVQEVIAHSRIQDNSAVEDYFKQFTADEIEILLQQQDVSFYITSKGLGLLIPVPHSIGDYVDFLILWDKGGNTGVGSVCD